MVFSILRSFRPNSARVPSFSAQLPDRGHENAPPRTDHARRGEFSRAEAARHSVDQGK
jgi:hypothetical protein